MTRAELWGRVTSVCASAPFQFTRAQSPFNFALQPVGQIDGVFRLTSEQEAVIGGFNYSEERTDTLEIWLARLHNGQPQAMYERLLTDITSLTAAIVRDGAQVSGEYAVLDGGAARIEADDATTAYAVGRLALPVNYESVL